MPEPEFLKIDQAASLLGMTKAALRSLRHRGEGPAYCKVNSRNVRYAVTDLQAWMLAHRVDPGAAQADKRSRAEGGVQ